MLDREHKQNRATSRQPTAGRRLAKLNGVLASALIFGIAGTVFAEQ